MIYYEVAASGKQSLDLSATVFVAFVYLYLYLRLYIPHSIPSTEYGVNTLVSLDTDHVR
jgi:hypothetical protein